MINVAEAAERLGVGVSRIHQRIVDGSLPAARVGSQWVIDETSLAAVSESRRPGRPLSHRSAWALLALSQADQRAFGVLAPTERSRAMDRMQRLLSRSAPSAPPSEARVHAVASLLRSWLRNRAERHRYRASPRDLPDVRRDDRVVRSGVSHPLSGIASGDLVEGYVAAEDLGAVVDDHLLSSVALPGDANVVLHVSSAALPRNDDIPPLLLAADLAEHRRPREEARAVELIQELAREQPEFVTEARKAREAGQQARS